MDSPAFSDPATELFRRVRRAEREAVSVLYMDALPPLQVRAGGGFGHLLESKDPNGLESAPDTLSDDVAAATDAFARTPIVVDGPRKVLSAGPGQLIGLDDPSDIDLVADDGSLAGPLRDLQPAASLDSAGALPVRSHGSTTQNILAVGESIARAQQLSEHLIVIGDDSGDGLDASRSTLR